MRRAFSRKAAIPHDRRSTCRMILRAVSGSRHAGATFPRVRIAQETKLAKNRLESLALEHELLAFSGCAGLRLFAAFVKLEIRAFE